jgi:hypothetical protein
VQVGVGSFQQRVEGRRVVSLPRSQMKMERVAVPIAQDVDFRGKAPAGAA